MINFFTAILLTAVMAAVYYLLGEGPVISLNVAIILLDLMDLYTEEPDEYAGIEYLDSRSSVFMYRIMIVFVTAYMFNVYLALLVCVSSCISEQLDLRDIEQWKRSLE